MIDDYARFVESKRESWPDSGFEPRGMNGGVITFRVHVGNGEYKGHEFRLGVATTPAGDLLGLPVVSWDDGITVTFEMEDLIPKAYELRGDA